MFARLLRLAVLFAAFFAVGTLIRRRRETERATFTARLHDLASPRARRPDGVRIRDGRIVAYGYRSRPTADLTDRPDLRAGWVDYEHLT